MAATASYDNATKIITVASDALPAPVIPGAFPNDNNPNTIQEKDWDHDFLYRGGTFGITRTFDNNGYTHDGFVRRATISTNDLTLFTGPNPDIDVNDEIMVVFSDGLKQKFIFRSTTFTSIDGECWLSTDTTLDFIVADQATTPVSGTMEYFDQRNGRGDTPLGQIGIAGNGVAIFNPSAGAGLNPPSGFSWVAAGDLTFVNSGEDNCGGHPEQSGQYHYHDPHFLDCWRAGSSMASYNDYYGGTQYNGDNIRHPDGHSKIIGIAFDGFPIYGPYGYATPFNNLSGTRTMRTGYAVRDSEIAGRPDYGNTSDNPPAGTLMEDYEYVEGTGDLDLHNGRFTITPEYQDGTYAYFLTVDETDVAITKFPYIIGKLACSSDLCISKNNTFITNEHSRKVSHLLRYENQAILTTYKTVNSDNPKLTCRINGLEKFSPIKIIIDKNLKIKLNSYIINNSVSVKTIIFHNSKNFSKIQILKN